MNCLCIDSQIRFLSSIEPAFWSEERTLRTPSLKDYFLELINLVALTILAVYQRIIGNIERSNKLLAYRNFKFYYSNQKESVISSFKKKLVALAVNVAYIENPKKIDERLDNYFPELKKNPYYAKGVYSGISQEFVESYLQNKTDESVREKVKRAAEKFAFGATGEALKKQCAQYKQSKRKLSIYNNVSRIVSEKLSAIQSLFKEMDQLGAFLKIDNDEKNKKFSQLEKKLHQEYKIFLSVKHRLVSLTKDVMEIYLSKNRNYTVASYGIYKKVEDRYFFLKIRKKSDEKGCYLFRVLYQKGGGHMGAIVKDGKDIYLFDPNIGVIEYQGSVESVIKEFVCYSKKQGSIIDTVDIVCCQTFI